MQIELEFWPFLACYIYLFVLFIGSYVRMLFRARLLHTTFPIPTFALFTGKGRLQVSCRNYSEDEAVEGQLERID